MCDSLSAGRAKREQVEKRERKVCEVCPEWGTLPKCGEVFLFCVLFDVQKNSNWTEICARGISPDVFLWNLWVSVWIVCVEMVQY